MPADAQECQERQRHAEQADGLVHVVDMPAVGHALTVEALDPPRQHRVVLVQAEGRGGGGVLLEQLALDSLEERVRRLQPIGAEEARVLRGHAERGCFREVPPPTASSACIASPGHSSSRKHRSILLLYTTRRPVVPWLLDLKKESSDSVLLVRCWSYWGYEYQIACRRCSIDRTLGQKSTHIVTKSTPNRSYHDRLLVVADDPAHELASHVCIMLQYQLHGTIDGALAICKGAKEDDPGSHHDQTGFRRLCQGLTSLVVMLYSRSVV